MIRFIVGTDTDVGKTYYGRLLMAEGHHLIKPIETGKISFEDIEESDAYGYARGQGLAIEMINMYFFDQPVSPHYASQIDNVAIDIEALKSFIANREEVVAELAGGLMVPITDNYTQLDFIKSFDDPRVDLVVANKLGCINHSLMTIKILKEANIKIETIVINNFNKKPTPTMINNIATIEMWVGNQTSIRVI